MKTIYVEQIRERDWVESPFLVRDKIMAMAKNGKPYMTLKLMDRTGEVEGRIWDRVDALTALFEKDDFIKVQGKASVYMGRMQLVIQHLERVEEEGVDLGDYLPVSERETAEMVAELRALVAGMADPHLKALLQGFIDDETFLHQYSIAPAAKAMHHVCLGGLLEHSLSVAALALDVSRRYSRVDRDLLVAGALLHDVGKVAELRYRRSFDYTDEGKLLGHIVIGVEMVTEKIRTMPDFPPMLATLLKHLLLSHHGQYEFGSPKRPKMIEAIILNFIDDLDSKINGVQTHIDKEPDSPSDWTAYHRLYDRYFFKHGNKTATSPEEESSARLREPARDETPATGRGNTDHSRRGSGRRTSGSLSEISSKAKVWTFSVLPKKKRSQPMQIETLAVGPLQVNCHIVACEETGKAAVIDPGGDADRILQALEAADLTLQMIINTHCHFDHIGGNMALVEKTGAELLVHEAELPILSLSEEHSRGFGLPAVVSPEPSRLLNDGDELEVGTLRLKVIHVPGHSPGGICLSVPGHLFCGDALFAGSIGRTDLPGGDFEALVGGIRSRLLVLPDETEVHPGHGPDTTIGREKTGNPFL